MVFSIIWHIDLILFSTGNKSWIEYWTVSTYLWWNVISWNMYFDRRLTSLVAALLWRPTPHMVTVLYSLLDCRGGARSIWRRSAGRRWRQSWPVQTSSAEDSSPLPVTLSTEVLITHECLAKENTKPDLIYIFLVAIILPYRNRESHMRVFLRHIHPILMRQDILYRYRQSLTPIPWPLPIF